MICIQYKIHIDHGRSQLSFQGRAKFFRGGKIAESPKYTTTVNKMTRNLKAKLNRCPSPRQGRAGEGADGATAPPEMKKVNIEKVKVHNPPEKEFSPLRNKILHMPLVKIFVV